MLKKFDPVFKTGSLFLCSKCGVSFDKPENAEQLKVQLRQQLKTEQLHSEVRVMVSGCLGVCQDDEQAFAFYPNQGPVELYTATADQAQAAQEILTFIRQSSSKS